MEIKKVKGNFMLLKSDNLPLIEMTESRGEKTCTVKTKQVGLRGDMAKKRNSFTQRHCPRAICAAALCLYTTQLTE